MKQQPDELRCPVCASSSYNKVKVELPDGEIYGMDVYRCAQCSYRFLDRSRRVPYLETVYRD